MLVALHLANFPTQNCPKAHFFYTMMIYDNGANHQTHAHEESTEKTTHNDHDTEYEHKDVFGVLPGHVRYCRFLVVPNVPLFPRGEVRS